MFVLLDAEMPRHRSRVLELVERVLVEADRRRDDPPGAGVGHGRHDRARVDAAREKRAERHVADQAKTHGFADERVEPLEIFLFAADVAVARELQIPVRANRHVPALGDEQMRRRQLRNRAIDRVRAGHVGQREVRVERVRAPCARHVGILEDGLDLRSEGDAGRGHRVVERLHAEPIAHEQQPAVRLVPQREREHPAEAIHRAVAPLLVCVDDHFGVRLRAEAVAEPLELQPEVREVVDLAVEDDPDRPVLVGERLIARSKIDDAQPPVSEADPVADVEAVGIGAAVCDDRGHRGQPIAIDRPGRVEAELACDTAHVRMPPAAVGRSRAHRGA